MKNTNLESNYYFIPLGREPGGYLDFLGLPPNASESEAAARANQYMRKIENDKKTKGKQLNANKGFSQLKLKQTNGEINPDKFEQGLKKIEGKLFGYSKLKKSLNNGKIDQEAYDATLEGCKIEFEALIVVFESNPLTQEEFSVQEDMLSTEYTEKLMHLNDLKETYDAKLAHARDLANRGLVDEDVLWLEMYRPFWTNQELYWQWISRCQPLPKTSASMAPSQSEATHLATIRRQLFEQRATQLSLADLLWGELRHTNRHFWQKKVIAWVEELEQLGPSLQTESEKTIDHITNQGFSSLSEPTLLAIHRLESEEVEEVAQMPTRAGDPKPIDFASLLNAMLAKQQGG